MYHLLHARTHRCILKSTEGNQNSVSSGSTKWFGRFLLAGTALCIGCILSGGSIKLRLTPQTLWECGLASGKTSPLSYWLSNFVRKASLFTARMDSTAGEAGCSMEGMKV